MNHDNDEFLTDNKLDNRGLLILLNERFRNLDNGVKQLNLLQSVFQKEFYELKIEVERLKTTGRIYTSLIAFAASIAASIITAMILR